MKTKLNKWNITKDFLIKEYVEKKRSLPEISKSLGMPYETLFYYKKQFGITSHTLASWHLGKRRSINTEFKKGNKPWNKNIKGLAIPWNKGKKLSESYKKKCQ